MKLKYIKYSLFTFYFIVILFLLYGKIVTPKTLKKMQTIELLDNNNDPYYYLCNDEEINYIPLTSIRKKTVDMFVNTEDKKFFSHSGFDLLRIGNAVWNNLTTHKTIGASTITQQFARNLYLTNEKTFSRKIKELYFAIQIEKECSKKEILEGYLNTLYFGHSIYGIHDASYFFFNKHPSFLSICESAILISVINSPGRYSPLVDMDACIKKRNVILKDALKYNVISLEEYNTSLVEEFKIYGNKDQVYSSTMLFYKDMVIKELKKLGYYDNQNFEHLVIHTAYDMKLNSFIESFNLNSDIAIVSIEKTGAVTSIIGSNDYESSSYNRATSSIPLGSTVKPFLYYQAINCGLSPLYEMKSEKTSFDDYSPSNNNDIYEDDYISMIYALATSDNIYAVKMLNLLGIKNFKEVLEKVNLSVSDNLSIALGTNEDSLFNLTRAYSYLANMGRKTDPFFIYKIFNNEKIVYEYVPSNEYILDSSTCFVINDMLKSVFDVNLNHKASVTGASISNLLTKTYAGKSGTSSDNLWMLGYNPLITIGVWSNNENPKYIWARMMEYYMNDTNDIWYEKPENVYFRYVNPSGLDIKYEKWIAFKTKVPYSKRLK